MKEWIETLKDALYNPHDEPITITENEGRGLIEEIEALLCEIEDWKSNCDALNDAMKSMPTERDLKESYERGEQAGYDRRF